MSFMAITSSLPTAEAMNFPCWMAQPVIVDMSPRKRKIKVKNYRVDTISFIVGMYLNLLAFPTLSKLPPHPPI
jgi:hypothetical protein